MTAALAFDIGLALLVLVVAIWSTVTRNLFDAVVGFIAYGVLLGLVWVRLSSVDVALTEVAIGSGLTGAMLLRAVSRTRGPKRPSDMSDAITRRVAAFLCILVTAGLAAVVLLLPDPAPTLAHTAAAHLPPPAWATLSRRFLMTYRAFDTFLEKVVLVLALFGVWSLASNDAWGSAPGISQAPDPDGVLKFLAQILVPVGIVFSLYTLWAGADHPGGAFQGGAVLAAMWILLMLAGFAKPPRVTDATLRFGLVVGAALFLVIGLAGLAFGNAFLAFPPAYAKALIIVIEVAMIVSVAAALTLIVAGPPVRGGRDDVCYPLRLMRGRVGRRGLVRPDRAARPSPQDHRLQPAWRRHLPFVRGRSPQGRCRRLRWRSRTAGDGHHRPRRRFLGHRLGSCADPAAPSTLRTPAGDEQRWSRSVMLDAVAQGGAIPTRDDLLVLAIVLPVAGILISVAVGKRYAERVVLVLLPVGLAIAVAILFDVVRVGAPLSYILGAWSPPLGITLRADGISAAMLVTTALVISATAIFAQPVFPTSAGVVEARAPLMFWTFLLAVWAALNAVFLGGDLFNLYVALELLTFGAVPLVCLDGRAKTVEAALRYLLFALAGSVLYLLGTALLYGAYGTLDIALLSGMIRPEPVVWIAVALMTAGLLAKTALFPLHLWLPPAHAGAAAPASAILSALVVKGSFFLIVRIWFDVTPGQQSVAAAQIIGAMGAAAIIFGSVLALQQDRLKLLIAYSTVAQIGYLFLMFPLAIGGDTVQTWSGTAWTGGWVQLFLPRLRQGSDVHGGGTDR